MYEEKRDLMPDDKSEDQQTATVGAPKFDVQEFLGITEDEIVDFDTPEEFLLHFSRVGQHFLVGKLLRLREENQISLNIDCKG